jgi:hypothetical protein
MPCRRRLGASRVNLWISGDIQMSLSIYGKKVSFYDFVKSGEKRKNAMFAVA